MEGDRDVGDEAARSAPDWETLSRLLGDECDGPHGGGHMWTVYAFDVAGRRSWYCKSCWIAAWRREQGLRWEA